MLKTRDFGLTTFVEEYEDGSQLHRSDPVVEVGVLNEEVLDAIGELGKDYKVHPEYVTEGQGLGLSVKTRAMLGAMPPLDYSLRDQPMNVAGHRLLAAFARQMQTDLDDSQCPTYVRAIFSGPQSSREKVIPLIWHTDALIPAGARLHSEMTADLPSSKRLVVGMVIDGEEGERGNTEWLSGDLILNKPVPLQDDTRTYSDIFWSEPHDRARITQDGNSIIRLALHGEEVDSAMIHSLDDGIIGEIGTTTVYRGVLGSTALRVSLQCYFTQNMRE